MPTTQSQYNDTILCGEPGQSGHPCRKRAGEGTDHPGIGPCYLHEEGFQATSGRYLPLLDMLDADTRPLVVRMLENDDELFNLRFELATLKAKYATNYDLTSIGNLIKLVRTITYTSKSLHDMEQGKHYYVHVNVLALVLEAVGQVARQYLPEGQRESFSGDLRHAMRMMLPETTSKALATSALTTPIERGVDGEVVDGEMEEEMAEVARIG